HGPRLPLERPGRDRRRLLRALRHERERLEDRAERLPEVVGAPPDRLLRRIDDLADPAGRDRVEPLEHPRRSLRLQHRPSIAPDDRLNLVPRERGDLGVETAERDDLDVALRVPALLPGQDAREYPGGGAD